MGDFPLRHPHDPPIRREGSRGTTIILRPGRYDGPPTLMASAMARTVPMISTATAGAWPLSRNEARNPEKKRMVVPLPKAKNGASGNKFPSRPRHNARDDPQKHERRFLPVSDARPLPIRSKRAPTVRRRRSLNRAGRPGGLPLGLSGLLCGAVNDTSANWPLRRLSPTPRSKPWRQPPTPASGSLSKSSSARRYGRRARPELGQTKSRDSK